MLFFVVTMFTFGETDFLFRVRPHQLRSHGRCPTWHGIAVSRWLYHTAWFRISAYSVIKSNVTLCVYTLVDRGVTQLKTKRAFFCTMLTLYIHCLLPANLCLCREPLWPTTLRIRCTPHMTCRSVSLCSLRRYAASLAVQNGWELKWVWSARLVLYRFRLSSSSFCHVSFDLYCSILQRGYFKSEAGEVRKNRPNLRRRMGTYVAKPEPGKSRYEYIVKLQSPPPPIANSSMCFSGHVGERGDWGIFDNRKLWRICFKWQ